MTIQKAWKCEATCAILLSVLAAVVLLVACACLTVYCYQLRECFFGKSRKGPSKVESVEQTPDGKLHGLAPVSSDEMVQQKFDKEKKQDQQEDHTTSQVACEGQVVLQVVQEADPVPTKVDSCTAVTDKDDGAGDDASLKKEVEGSDGADPPRHSEATVESLKAGAYAAVTTKTTGEEEAAADDADCDDAQKMERKEANVAVIVAADMKDSNAEKPGFKQCLRCREWKPRLELSRCENFTAQCSDCFVCLLFVETVTFQRISGKKLMEDVLSVSHQNDTRK